MSLLYSLLRTVVADLRVMGTPFALVGGVAVSLRCEARFTRDVDLVIAVTGDREAEQIGRAMIQRGYAPVLQAEHELTGRLATVRLAAPGADPQSRNIPIVDMIFATCGIEPEIVASAEPLEVVEGLVVPTARVEHLLAMKVLSFGDQREQDILDIRALLRVASAEQIDTTRRLLKLIAQRGYHRDRDLIARLEQWL